jgi:hypothetical protein
MALVFIRGCVSAALGHHRRALSINGTLPAVKSAAMNPMLIGKIPNILCSSVSV